MLNATARRGRVARMHLTERTIQTDHKMTSSRARAEKRQQHSALPAPTAQDPATTGPAFSASSCSEPTTDEDIEQSLSARDFQ